MVDYTNNRTEDFIDNPSFILKACGGVSSDIIKIANADISGTRGGGVVAAYIKEMFAKHDNNIGQIIKSSDDFSVESINVLSKKTVNK